VERTGSWSRAPKRAPPAAPELTTHYLDLPSLIPPLTCSRRVSLVPWFGDAESRPGLTIQTSSCTSLIAVLAVSRGRGVGNVGGVTLAREL